MNHIDFKKFKKVKEDKDSSTLQHDDGHQMRILHKPLTHRMRAQLKALPMMADGGEVISQDKKDTKQPQPTTPPQDDPTPIGKRINFPGMAEGGEVANNPKLQESHKTPPQYERQFEGVQYEPIKPQHPVQYEKLAQGGMAGNRAMYAEAGVVDPANLPYVDPNGEVLNQQAAPDAPFTFGGMSPSVNPLAGLQDPQQNNMIPQQSDQAAPIQAQNRQPASEVPQSNQNSSIASNSSPSLAPQATPLVNTDPNLLKEGYEQQVKGIGQEAQATGQLGKEETKAIGDFIQAGSREEALNTFKNKAKELDQHFTDITHDIQNKHISDDHYWANHSKLATGLGIILAGFNPTNSPNAAIEFLKSNLDRDTNQQIAEMGQKNNLLSHLTQQFGNVKDAAAFVNATKAQQLSDQLQFAAAKSKDPNAQARLNEMAGQLRQQYYPQYINMQMRQAMIQASQLPHSDARVPAMINTLRPFAPEVAKEMEGRYVPGEGLANIPVPQDVRNKFVSHQQLTSKIDDLSNWATQNKGAILRGDLKAIAEGKAKALGLQQSVREAQLNTVFRESEKPLLEQLVSSDPTSLFSGIKLQPQLKELRRANLDNANILRQSYDLPVKENAQNTQQVQYMNGQPYHKVANGWQRVK